jgi:hypothetical protein
MQAAKTNSVTGVENEFCKRYVGDLPHSSLSQLALHVSSLKTKVCVCAYVCTCVCVCMCLCVCVRAHVRFAHASPMKPSNA